MLKIPSWCYQCNVHISKNIESILSGFCINCYRELPFCDFSKCQKCGGDHTTTTCTEQWTHNLHQFFSVFDYEQPVSSWVPLLKYGRNFSVGKILQQIIQLWMDEHAHLLTDIDFIIPVPLHPHRLRQRGFNQASYLLQKQSVLPVRETLLKRVRPTPHQAGLSKEQRVTNLKNAFQSDISVRGQHVLVFDDVLTTGNTIREISKTLAQQGAARISVLVLSQAHL